MKYIIEPPSDRMQIIIPFTSASDPFTAHKAAMKAAAWLANELDATVDESQVSVEFDNGHGRFLTRRQTPRGAK